MDGRLSKKQNEIVLKNYGTQHDSIYPMLDVRIDDSLAFHISVHGSDTASYEKCKGLSNDDGRCVALQILRKTAAYTCKENSDTEEEGEQIHFCPRKYIIANHIARFLWKEMKRGKF